MEKRGRPSNWQVDISKALIIIKEDIAKQNENIDDLIKVLQQHEEQIEEMSKIIQQLVNKNTK